MEINLTEFERQVVSDLAELKADMKTLVGNGQPGRVTKLEDKVQRLIIWLVAIGVLILGPAGVVWFLK